MAKKGRVGSIPLKGFFPRSGDILALEGGDETYECIRKNTIEYEGEPVQYCLVAVRNPTGWGTAKPIYISYTDQDDEALDELLKCVQTVERKRSKGGGSIVYKYDKKTRCWLQQGEDE